MMMMMVLMMRGRWVWWSGENYVDSWFGDGYDEMVLILVLVAAGDGMMVEWAGDAEDDDDDGVGDDDDECGGDGQCDISRTSNKANMK